MNITRAAKVKLRTLSTLSYLQLIYLQRFIACLYFNVLVVISGGFVGRFKCLFQVLIGEKLFQNGPLRCTVTYFTVFPFILVVIMSETYEEQITH